MVFSFLIFPLQAYSCGTPSNLQVSVTGNQVTFSWSGTSDADIHAILLRDESTGQNSKAYTTGSSYTATNIPNGQYTWRVIALCNTSVSLTDNSEWIWGSVFSMTGECTITPSIAQAGADQLSISGTSTTLAAISPAIGVGAWTIVSGTGGNIANTVNALSSFTGTAGITYVLRWTVSNSCGGNSDDVSIGFKEECPTPSIAQAGSDQMDVSGTSATLAAISPAIGVGAWTIVSGIGGNIANTANASSSFTGTAGTTYVLRWTVSNSCGGNSDDVMIEFINPYLNPNLNYGSVSDIDDNTYATIQIGTQRWMAENLKTTKYNDGTTIPNVTDNTAWNNLTTGAWSNYGNNSSNNNIYGKLYNWYAVKTGTLCPQGWHIPTDAEWTVLANYLGGTSVAGGKMKSVTGWNSPNIGATNESGFSGLPGGSRLPNGTFSYISSNGYWWSATEYNTYNAWDHYLHYESSNAYSYYYYKENGWSCRCLKD